MSDTRAVSQEDPEGEGFGCNAAEGGYDGVGCAARVDA